MSEYLTPEMVAASVNYIREIANDDFEVAHEAEDILYASIISAISQGLVVDAQECARIAILTKAIVFPRYCA